ncbi:MAG: SUMF1/EgtB/PvdO family nonheme iron enzyme, partial [Myxococcota bacterium]|nr:SUMF1/EgtB/PvdO family nonheme iron enzyme [Myxococcota bacterium]
LATQELRLLAVPHALVVRKEGYRERRLSVTPRPDFAQRVEVVLEKLAASRKAGGRGRKTSIGQKLVRVEPGSFTMGSPRGEPGRRSNEAERAVELTRPFYIGATEVTNREFRNFDPEHRPADHSGFALSGDQQPATRVSWEDAARFCNWLSRKESLPPAYVERGGTLVAAKPMGRGYRLPTEAEWAWAARFGAGKVDFRYPWGNEPDPPAGSGNYADASAAGIVPSVLLAYRDGYPVSAPVGANGANPLGLADVGGNVAEWVHDRYMLYPRSAREKKAKDPLGPDSGGLYVIRGSGWKHASPTQLRLSYRDYGKEAREDVGFRIARYAD